MPADTPMVLGPEQPWKRLLAMIAFGAVGYVLLPLLLVLAVAQFGFHLWGSQSNPRVAQLADAIKALLGSILDFLLYRSDLLPFPFNPLPGAATFGGHTTAWPDVEPPDIAPAAPSGWQACLLHLGRCRASEHTGPSIADAIRADETEALVAIGIRPWVLEGEAQVAFAARHAALKRLLRGHAVAGPRVALRAENCPRCSQSPDSNPAQRQPPARRGNSAARGPGRL